MKTGASQSEDMLESGKSIMDILAGELLSNTIYLYAWVSRIYVDDIC